MVMIVDCFRKQSLNLRQSKDGFRKSVELHLRQNPHPGSYAFHSSATSDEPMGALLPFAFLTIGNAVFVLLHFVLKLNKLPFTRGSFGFQLE